MALLMRSLFSDWYAAEIAWRQAVATRHFNTSHVYLAGAWFVDVLNEAGKGKEAIEPLVVRLGPVE